MGKVNKVRGKYEETKHSKVKCFLHILGEAEILQLGIHMGMHELKTWE